MNSKFIFICVSMCVLARTATNAHMDENDERKSENVIDPSQAICDDDDGAIWVHLFTKHNQLIAENRDFQNKLLAENQRILANNENVTLAINNLNQKITKLEIQKILATNENLTLEITNLNRNISKLETQKILATNEILTQEITNLSQKIAQLETHLNEKNGEFCDGGNWKVIQRRGSGSEDFYRTWEEYKNGFGNHVNDFWLGLEPLHKLTNSGQRYELMVIMEDFENDRRYASYDDFQIGSEREKYALQKLGQYKGTAGESLLHHVGQKFSTKDQDNDEKPDGNCAVLYPGGWWHKNCFHAHLNGVYQTKGDVRAKSASGIHWLHFRGHGYSLKFVQMMIRPKGK